MRKILVYLPFLLLSIFACNSNEEENLLPEEKTNAQFFEYSETNDEFKEFVIDYLKMEDDSIPFTAKFVRTYGIPKWDISIEHIASNTGVLVVPITDKNANKINALYYFVLGEETFEYYIFMNDKEDVAYETMKRFIQVFENKIGIEISNKEFRVKLVEKQINDNSTTKARRNESVSCFDEYAGSLENPYMYYKGTHCTPGTPDMEWYSNIDNSVNRDKINLPDPLRGKDGSNGSGEPEPRDPLPAPPVKTTQEFDDSKAGCIYKEMRSAGHEMLPSTLTDELLRGLEYPSSKINVTYKLTKELPDSKKGRCHSIIITNRIQGLVSGTIEILINQNVLDSRNFLQTGNTIFHETLHAYMKGMLYEAGLQVDISNFDFEETYSLYKTQYPQNQVDHAIWVDNYRDILKKNLESLFNNAPSEAQNSILNAINGYSGNLGDLDFLFTYMANSGLEGVGNNTFTVTPEERSILESDILSQIIKNCPY